MTPCGPHVCAVVLHYGDLGLTDRVQRQLLEGLPPGRCADIRVLDNAAPEAAPRAWRRLPENLFWAGALQWMVRHLQENEPNFTHLWFLNNDISFATPGPQLLRAEARLAWLESRLGTVGVYSPSVLRNPYHPQMIQDSRLQIREVCYVDGIAPLLNLAALSEQGGVDLRGNPYGYGVDVYTSLRQHQAGNAVVVDHQLAVRHTYHSTARRVSGFMERAARAEAAYLSARLGEEYASLLRQLQTRFTDHARL